MEQVAAILKKQSQDAAAKQKEDAETISKLEEKVKQQEVLIDELRRRIQAIQEAMERDGRTDVMAAVESIMDDVGLTGVMRAKKNDLEKVFDRLYRDAMERLERRGRLEYAMGTVP